MSEFLIFGKQTCLFVLENYSDKICEIYLGKDIDKALFAKFARLQKPILRLDSKKMQALAKGGNHQHFILKIKHQNKAIKDFRNIHKIVVLVGISDVGNIGSIFRTCLAFGVDLIISTNELNASGVARSSSGAFFAMPYMICKDYLNLTNELKMADFSLLGTDMNGENLNTAKIPPKWALFLGSEGEGLSNRLLKKMDLTLGIKMAHFNSLNVSVAAGIFVCKLMNN